MKRVSPCQLCARSLMDLLHSPATQNGPTAQYPKRQRLVRFRSCQFESKMLGQIDDERVKQLDASLRRRICSQARALTFVGVAETFVALNRGPRVEPMDIWSS